MGCIVNRAGRKQARAYRHFAAGHRRNSTAPVFVDGKKAATLRGERIAEEFQQMVVEYIESHYSKARDAA